MCWQCAIKSSTYIAGKQITSNIKAQSASKVRITTEDQVRHAYKQKCKNIDGAAGF